MTTHKQVPYARHAYIADDLTQVQEEALTDYRNAVQIRSFSATGIPGLLQTADYVTAMLTAYNRVLCRDVDVWA